jgi:hypothetical protein
MKKRLRGKQFGVLGEPRGKICMFTRDFARNVGERDGRVALGLHVRQQIKNERRHKGLERGRGHSLERNLFTRRPRNGRNDLFG